MNDVIIIWAPEFQAKLDAEAEQSRLHWELLKWKMDFKTHFYFPQEETTP